MRDRANRSRPAPSSVRRLRCGRRRVAGRHPVAAADLALGAPDGVLGDHEGHVRLAVVDRDREPERARQAVVLEALPALALVVRAIDAAVVLLPEPALLLGMEEHLVDALADLREAVVLVEVCGCALVLRRPRLAAVVAAEDPRGRDSDVDRVRIRRVHLDRVRAHAARARVPALARGVLDQAHDRFPVLASIVRSEECAWRRAEPERVPVAGLDVPRLLEREPSLLRQPEPLAALPGLASVGRALDGRAVHEVVRRRVQRPVVLGRMEDLPAGERRLFDRPLPAVLVAAEDEQALASPDQNRGSHRSVA
jgi:hypothetical protein